MTKENEVVEPLVTEPVEKTVEEIIEEKAAKANESTEVKKEETKVEEVEPKETEEETEEEEVLTLDSLTDSILQELSEARERADKAEKENQALLKKFKDMVFGGKKFSDTKETQEPALSAPVEKLNKIKSLADLKRELN